MREFINISNIHSYIHTFIHISYTGAIEDNEDDDDNGEDEDNGEDDDDYDGEDDDDYDGEDDNKGNDDINRKYKKLSIKSDLALKKLTLKAI